MTMTKKALRAEAERAGLEPGPKATIKDLEKLLGGTFPRKGKNKATVTGVCEVELPEGSRTKLQEHGKSRYNQMVRFGAPACQTCRTGNTQSDLEYRRRRRLEERSKEIKALDAGGPKESKQGPRKRAGTTKGAKVS